MSYATSEMFLDDGPHYECAPYLHRLLRRMVMISRISLSVKKTFVVPHHSGASLLCVRLVNVLDQIEQTLQNPIFRRSNYRHEMIKETFNPRAKVRGCLEVEEGMQAWDELMKQTSELRTLHQELFKQLR